MRIYYEVETLRLRSAQPLALYKSAVSGVADLTESLGPSDERSVALRVVRNLYIRNGATLCVRSSLAVASSASYAVSLQRYRCRRLIPLYAFPRKQVPLHLQKKETLRESARHLPEQIGSMAEESGHMPAHVVEQGRNMAEQSERHLTPHIVTMFT